MYPTIRLTRATHQELWNSQLWWQHHNYHPRRCWLQVEGEQALEMIGPYRVSCLQKQLTELEGPAIHWPKFELWRKHLAWRPVRERRWAVKDEWIWLTKNEMKWAQTGSLVRGLQLIYRRSSPMFQHRQYHALTPTVTLRRHSAPHMASFNHWGQD